jgi:hypothetical protein
MLSLKLVLAPEPIAGGPQATRLDGTGSHTLAFGQLLGVVVLLGVRVVYLVLAAEAPAIHEDLAVTTGSLGHQMSLQSGGSGRP